MSSHLQLQLQEQQKTGSSLTEKGTTRREGSSAHEEAGLQTNKWTPITLEMLSKGGYYDMPMSVSSKSSAAARANAEA